jgi:hypothetical protein
MREGLAPLDGKESVIQREKRATSLRHRTHDIFRIDAGDAFILTPEGGCV